jgi:beta-galactosidase
MGLYVLDEANIESHGLSYHKKVLPGDLPEWVAATCARGERMVIRDRGHACVVMWSLGNEAGYGSTFMKVREAMLAQDPEKRVIQYADMNRTHHLAIPLAYMSYYAVEQCIRIGKRGVKKSFKILQFRFYRGFDKRDTIHSQHYLSTKVIIKRLIRYFFVLLP